MIMTDQQQRDIELMRRVRRRDQSALAELYGHYGGPVYSIALHVLNNPGAAEEVTQNTFLQLWQKADAWDPERGALASWLVTLARYDAIDRLRSEQRRPVIDQPVDELPHLAEGAPGVEDPLWHDGQLLRELLTHLPREQAQAIYLAFFNGMTHHEIAQTAGLPLGTVKTRVRLGLQKLRNLWLEAVES